IPVDVLLRKRIAVLRRALRLREKETVHHHIRRRPHFPRARLRLHELPGCRHGSPPSSIPPIVDLARPLPRHLCPVRYAASVPFVGVGLCPAVSTWGPEGSRTVRKGDSSRGRAFLTPDVASSSRRVG